MSEREEVLRFDFEHPPCKGYGCCGGGGMEKYEDGEYVRYDDYAALRAKLATAERERDEARRERENVSSQLWDCTNERDGYKHRAERMARVVEAARPWIEDMWRGDLNGTAIGVCMEYEPDGQYVLWEQVAPIAEAVRALDAEAQP